MMDQLVMGKISTWLFFATLIVGLGIFLYVFYYRLQILALGRADNRFDQLPRRIGFAIKNAFLQYRMPQELSAGILHIMIFAGFMTLSLRTLIIFGQGFGGAEFSLYALPVVGYYLGPLYAIAKELVVIGVLIGCVGFAWRRLISKRCVCRTFPRWNRWSSSAGSVD